MRNWREEARSAAKRLLDRRIFNEFLTRRALLIVLIFATEAVLFFVVSNSPFLPGEEAAYLQSVTSSRATIQSESVPAEMLYIFANNAHVAISMLSPVLGQITFAGAIYNTARIIEAIGVIDGVSSNSLLATLYLVPHTWIETSAYALASAEAVYLVWAIVKGGGAGFSWDRLDLELTNVPAVVVMVLAVLAVAAVFEVLETQVSRELDLLFWLPFFALLYLVWRSGLLRRGETPPLTSAPQPTEPQASVIPEGDKLKHDIEMRVQTDRAVSAAWLFVPAAILASDIALTIYIIYGSIRLVEETPSGTPISPSSIPGFDFITGPYYIAAEYAIAAGIAALLYFLIRRRTEHFAREHLVFEDVITELKSRAARAAPAPEFESRMVLARKTLDGIENKETKRDPLTWALASFLVPPFILFAYYFLTKDFYRHEDREALLLSQLSSASAALGVNLAAWGRGRTLPYQSFAVYAVLTVVTFGIFWFYWNYRLIQDPEKHISSQWDIEDGIYTALRGNVTATVAGSANPS